MIIWGETRPGRGSDRGWDGARFDPVTREWRPINAEGGPQVWLTSAIGHYAPFAVWTGSEMLVWGDTPFTRSGFDGALYDPVHDSWRPMAMEGAPSPRSEYSIVWTGKELLIWGGFRADYENLATEVDPNYYLNTGARYDLATDRWLPISNLAAPRGRMNAAAVWTGSEMVVLGGSGGASGTLGIYVGGAYDPMNDRWRPVAPTDVQFDRRFPLAYWSGQEIVISGTIRTAESVFELGPPLAYDPATDQWRVITGAVPPQLGWENAPG
jgi:hypothetical protein